MSIPDLPAPGSDVQILLTRVNLNPFCELVELWGSFDQQQKVAYQHLAKDIQCPGKILNVLEVNPGDLCLVQVNETWYRARIVSRNVLNCSVFLIDKGFTLNATTGMLACGQKNFFHLPPEVEFCLLSNILPLSAENRWSPLAMDFLKSLIGKCVTANVLDVLVPNRTVLLDIPCISKQMYEMGFAKMLTPKKFKDFVLTSLQPRSGAGMSTESHPVSSLTDESFKVHEQMQEQQQQQFMYPELPMGIVETVLITEVTNPLRLSCHLKVFSEELKKLEKQITQYYEKRLAVSPVRPNVLGSPCAVRGSDGKWYRSVLQQIFPANNVVEVLQVDYGNTQFVLMENIRPLAVEFFRMPVVTYLCSLHGITDTGVGWTTTQVDYLRSLLLYKTVIAKFEYQSVSEGIHYVTLYGEESTNINVLFNSKVMCLLGSEKTYTDYTVPSTTSRPRHPVQLEYQGNEADPAEAMKRMETKTVKEIRLKFPVEDLPLNRSQVAVVQHVSNPSEFWIQTRKYVNEFNELMDGIAYHYSNPVCEDVVKNPTVGLYCAAKARDGAFYRAAVTKVSETHIQVYFVDYGNSRRVDKSNIRVLPDKFKELPQLALKCKLADVKPKGETWSHNATDFFTKTVMDKVLDVHVTARFDGGYVVEVTDPMAQGERDVRKLMCSSGFAEKDEAQNKSSAKVTIQPVITPTLQNPGAIPFDAYKNSGSCFRTLNTTDSTIIEGTLAFHEHLFPIGSVLDVNVTCIESPNDFWCQLRQSMGHLNLLMQDMQVYYAGSQFQPPVDKVCVARHPDNGMWYRAVVVKQHLMPHVDVLFVDYGQTKTVSLHDLRRISPAFLDLKGLALRCSLFNPVNPSTIVNDWGKEGKTRLQDFVDSAASSHAIMKCTIYAVMYNDLGIAFNVVDLVTPTERVCNRMVPVAKSAPLRKTSVPSSRLHTYNYSTHNIKMGTEERVSVTSVDSVSHFYCQLERNAGVVKDLAGKVGALCKQLENLDLPKIIGAACFAKYTDGHWYRGQIKATQPSILVHFVDYGDTIEVDKSHLLPIPIEASDIVAVPVQAIKCGLSDIPAKFPSEVNSWFATTATDHAFRALVVAKEPGGKLRVELYYGKTRISANIKERFCLEMHRQEHVVYQNGRGLEASNSDGQQAPNAVPKQACKVEHKSPAPTHQWSSPKALHPMKGEKESSKASQESDPKPTHQMAEKGRTARVTLELYQTPHQRIPNGMGSGSDPVEDICKPVKPTATEQEQVIVLKSPITKTENSGNVALEPKAEALPKLTELPSKSITSGMEVDVFVSHCNSPLSFYVQLAKEEDDILSFVEKLNDGQSTAEALDIKDLHIGDLVNAEFPDDSSWYRAVVREIHGRGTALVEFLDFGNTATVSISKICKLLKPFLRIPRYSTHCLLSGVAALTQEGELEPEVTSTFKQDIGGNEDKRLKCMFVRQSGSIWEVSLEDNGRKVICKTPIRGPTDISDVALERPVHVEKKLGQDLTSRELPPVKTQPKHCLKVDFSEGHSLEAYVATITDPQSFWCQSVNSEELDQITKRVSEVGNAVQCKPMNANMLSSGSTCVALFTDDDQWYRAEVIRRDGDVLTVFFVDYGNESQVNVNDVREMPPSLAESQPQAFLCQLEGFDVSHGAWGDGALDRLSELITDKLLQLTVLGVSREENRTMCFVQVECDGQVINETMKVHWKSSAIEKQHEATGASDTYVMAELSCESTMKKLTGPEFQQHTSGYVEQQDELVITQTADQTSEVERTPNNPDCFNDTSRSEPIADAQKEDEDHIQSECDVTDEPHPFTEGVSLREMVTDIMDQMKTIPTIVISDVEPSDTGVIEPLSEDIGEDQITISPPAEDNLTTSIDKNVLETDKNNETVIASVLCLQANFKSALYSPANPEEAPTVAERLGTKEEYSHIGEDESEVVVLELETLPEEPGITNGEDDIAPDFEFAQPLRAADTLPAGSTCVVGSPAVEEESKGHVINDTTKAPQTSSTIENKPHTTGAPTSYRMSELPCKSTNEDLAGPECHLPDVLENPVLLEGDPADSFMDSLDELMLYCFTDASNEEEDELVITQTIDVTSEVPNIFNIIDHFDDIGGSQPFADAQNENPILSECYMTDKPQPFTEDQSLRDIVPDIVDEMKTILIFDVEPSDAGVIEVLSEDIGENQTMPSPPSDDSQRYNPALTTDINSETKIVSVVQQAVGVDDEPKSVLHSYVNLVEAAVSYGDQIQKNYEFFQLSLVADSTESVKKEEDSHVGGDKLETVVAELEMPPEEPEPKDEDSNTDIVPDSEFGRLLAAGDILPVGSTCVVWSPAVKSWCEARVLKNTRDFTLVLLVGHDTEIMVDPASIFEMVLSQPMQCDSGDCSIDFDMGSSQAVSPIRWVADTELAVSEQQLAGDTVPTDEMGDAFVEATCSAKEALVSADLVAETEMLASEQSAPKVPDELGAKEEYCQVGEDELETLPEEPEPRDDTNTDIVPDSEFGRLLRAGDTLPVGSTCVVLSPAVGSWCKATVLKNLRDCSLVLLVDHNTQVMVDPVNIFEMVLSQPMQCDSDDDSIDFDTASSHTESPIGWVADTELAVSGQQLAGDTVPTNRMDNVFAEAACPATEALQADLVAETEAACPATEALQADLAAETEAAYPATEALQADLAAETEAAYPATEALQADLTAETEAACLATEALQADLAAETEAAYPATEALQSDLAAETEAAYPATEALQADLVAETEAACPATEALQSDLAAETEAACPATEALQADLVAETEALASEPSAYTAPIHNMDNELVEATCHAEEARSADTWRAEQSSTKQEYLVSIDDSGVEVDVEVLLGAATQQAPPEDLKDIMSEEETDCSGDKCSEVQMSMLTHLFLLTVDHSDSSCVVSTETTSAVEE